MAILKMKKLRLLVFRSRREELMGELIRRGCVEFSRIDESIKGSGAEALLSPEGRGLSELEAGRESLVQALELLDKYAPATKRIQLRRPELEEGVLLDDTGLRFALRKAEAIVKLHSRIEFLSAEQKRLSAVMDSLKPWLAFKIALGLEQTERCSMFIGSVPIREDLDALCAELEKIDDESELFPVNEDKSSRYIVFVCMRESHNEMLACLQRHGFSRAPTEPGGSAVQDTVDSRTKILEYQQEEKHCRRLIAEEGIHREELKLAADRLSVKISLAGVEELFYGTESSLLMEGWVPQEREAELTELFEQFGCAYEFISPEAEEHPEVPVRLKNNRFMSALNRAAGAHSLPVYGSTEPEPLMAPFIALFFGLLAADVGGGLVMLLSALIAMAAQKRRGGGPGLCWLLLFAGAAGCAVGALCGRVFGGALTHMGELLDMSMGWAELRPLLPASDAHKLLPAGSALLGLVYINCNMLISFVKKCRCGQLMDGVWTEGALWLCMAGLVFYVLNIGSVHGLPLPLILGVLLLLAGAAMRAKRIGRILSAPAALLNTLVRWLLDILFYARLTALLLAGILASAAFNALSLRAGDARLFFAVFAAGQLLSTALYLMGCRRHELRLKLRDYFKNIFKEGRPFRPLELKTKFFKPVE